jgi:Bacterial CdiA-CT RNAse A domain
VLTRAGTYPDVETARWCTGRVLAENDVEIRRWVARGIRRRLVVEANWPSRPEPVGRVLLQGMLFAGLGPVDVRAARVVLERDDTAPHGFVVRGSVPVYW